MDLRQADGRQAEYTLRACVKKNKRRGGKSEPLVGPSELKVDLFPWTREAGGAPKLAVRLGLIVPGTTAITAAVHILAVVSVRWHVASEDGL